MLFSKLGIHCAAHTREIILSVEIVISDACGDKLKSATIYSPYPDIPPINVIVPEFNQIIEDKISAILQRDKARDVHDLYILLKQGGQIKSKVNKKKFKEKLLEKQKLWKSLEPLILNKLEPFENEVRYILSCLK